MFIGSKDMPTLPTWPKYPSATHYRACPPPAYPARWELPLRNITHLQYRAAAHARSSTAWWAIASWAFSSLGKTMSGPRPSFNTAPAAIPHHHTFSTRQNCSRRGSSRNRRSTGRKSWPSQPGATIRAKERINQVVLSCWLSPLVLQSRGRVVSEWPYLLPPSRLRRRPRE